MVGGTQGKKNQNKENASEAGGTEVRLLETPPSQGDKPRGGGQSPFQALLRGSGDWGLVHS